MNILNDSFPEMLTIDWQPDSACAGAAVRGGESH